MLLRVRALRLKGQNSNGAPTTSSWHRPTCYLHARTVALVGTLAPMSTSSGPARPCALLYLASGLRTAERGGRRVNCQYMQCAVEPRVQSEQPTTNVASRTHYTMVEGPCCCTPREHRPSASQHTTIHISLWLTLATKTRDPAHSRQSGVRRIQCRSMWRTHIHLWHISPAR